MFNSKEYSTLACLCSCSHYCHQWLLEARICPFLISPLLKTGKDSDLMILVVQQCSIYRFEFVQGSVKNFTCSYQLDLWPLTFVPGSSWLMGDGVPQPGPQACSQPDNHFPCWAREIQCKMSKKAPYPLLCPNRRWLHKRLPEPLGNVEHRHKFLPRWSLLIQTKQRNASTAKTEID